jgi:predicted DNA binding CopG/RHH family protein
MTQETQLKPKRRRVNLTLPAETHGKIKVWCAKRGISMQAQIEKWLNDVAARVAE